MNTIFAQASAQGKAGVSVFRISGLNALRVLETLGFVKMMLNLNRVKCISRRSITLKNNQQIDDVLVVFFKGKASFTGEDSVEIYTHGSIAVIKMMHEVLASLEDVRMAEPGEFAKRAFLNGKMDLTAAEGLADLIDAETELQHSQAIKQLGGGLEEIYERWRGELLKVISLIEAYIDFPDEDIPEETMNEVKNLIGQITNEIKVHLDDNHRGERLRSGIKLAIIGRPNVGKSSLLNYLMKREIAIVSNIAGTTRDVIEGHLDIGGYPFILQDTAGIHDHTEDIIEQEGIIRARSIAKNSNIKIIIYDANRIDEDKEYFEEIADDNTLIVFNKMDLTNGIVPKTIHELSPIPVSIKNQQGLDEIMTGIIAIAHKIARPSTSPQITRARHRSELQKALEYMSSFSLNDDLVLAAEDLRMTSRALSSITGKITVDEILGEIFSNFCIGK
jgi:tRNA modification GTPase